MTTKSPALRARRQQVRSRLLLASRWRGRDANRRVGDFRDQLRTAENVNDVDLFGNVFEAGIAFFTEDQ